MTVARQSSPGLSVRGGRGAGHVSSTVGQEKELDMSLEQRRVASLAVLGKEFIMSHVQLPLVHTHCLMWSS